MSNRHAEQGLHMRPNSWSWILATKAYFNCRTLESVRNAERVLERMKGVHREELMCYNGDLASDTASADGKYDDGGRSISCYDVEDESRKVRRIVTPYTLFFVGVCMLRMEDDGADKEKDKDYGLLLLLAVRLLIFLDQQWLRRFLLYTKQSVAYTGWDDVNG